MGLGPGATAGGPYGPLVPGTPREPPLETQHKKHSRAPQCSVCGKIIPASLATIRDNKVYCKECFKRNVGKSARKTNASSRHMIR